MARHGARPGTELPHSWVQPCSASSSAQASSQLEAHKGVNVGSRPCWLLGRRLSQVALLLVIASLRNLDG